MILEQRDELPPCLSDFDSGFASSRASLGMQEGDHMVDTALCLFLHRCCSCPYPVEQGLGVLAAPFVKCPVAEQSCSAL